MWYKLARELLASYESTYKQQLEFKLRQVEFYQNEIKFLNEAKVRNPDKIQEIDEKIKEMLEKANEKPLFPYDDNGGDYLYHSTNNLKEIIEEGGLSGEYSCSIDHKSFSEEGCTFFTDYPQIGYGQDCLRVRRVNYNFKSDLGEYYTKDNIPIQDIEVYQDNGTWQRIGWR